MTFFDPTFTGARSWLPEAYADIFQMSRNLGGFANPTRLETSAITPAGEMEKRYLLRMAHLVYEQLTP